MNRLMKSLSVIFLVFAFWNDIRNEFTKWFLWNFLARRGFLFSVFLEFFGFMNRIFLFGFLLLHRKGNRIKLIRHGILVLSRFHWTEFLNNTKKRSKFNSYHWRINKLSFEYTFIEARNKSSQQYRTNHPKKVPTIVISLMKPLWNKELSFQTDKQIDL